MREPAAAESPESYDQRITAWEEYKRLRISGAPAEEVSEAREKVLSLEGEKLQAMADSRGVVADDERRIALSEMVQSLRSTLVALERRKDV